MIVAEFVDFMEQIHGHPPFPWQTTMVKEVVERGEWPSLVDVPTGLGKTSMLDVAVFVLAMSAGGDAPQYLGRRRMYLVVDRRIVVDQAEQHGQRIVLALNRAVPGTVVGEVAARLRRLAGAGPDEPPLRVVKMRGGTTWDAAWLPRPDLPAIVTGTVDQVGSRLLFRGYGVSARRRPIDAALVGADSVIMVDEAHISQAFTTTLAATRQFDSTACLGLPGTSVVHLTATSVGVPTGWVAGFDEEAHIAHPVAAQRLSAPKTLTFVDSSEKAVVADIIAKVKELLEEGDASEPTLFGHDSLDSVPDEPIGSGPRILVVCNTVDRARQVYEALTDVKLKRSAAGAETLMLIGRSRALDREAVAARVTELFGAGRAPTPEAAVLVATQTIEVGIDLDATHMVTETASWDALVQRIGRVNRRGLWPRATVTVVEDGVALDEKKHRPAVYGKAKLATAEYLRHAAEGGLDASPLALHHVVVPTGLSAPSPVIPVLLPAQLDAWVRTSPAPSNDPPLDPYLHGIDQSLAPVSVAWRDGLVDRDGSSVSALEAGAVLGAVPVMAEETIEIPLGAFSAWLQGSKPVPVADVDDFDDIPFGDDDDARQVLRRGADGSWQWIACSDVRPGDSVVVPTEYGGVDRFGWNPGCRESVTDLAELAAWRRGRVILRLDANLGERVGLGLPSDWADLKRAWRNADEPEIRDAASHALIHQVLASLEGAQEGLTGWTRRDLVDLHDAIQMGPRIAEAGEGGCLILSGSGVAAGWRSVEEDITGGSSHVSGQVLLQTHLNAVGKRAAEFATRLGIPDELCKVVVDAARWHDIGKVDPRFQAMLWGGDTVAAELADEPLAKSGMPPGDHEQFRRARHLSRMPRGARHEAWSQVLVEMAMDERGYVGDRELLAHLVASHHGHARPLLPPVDDPSSHELEGVIDGTLVRVGLPKQVPVSDADRFARLNARYGRWGLAFLETIVRCADMTVSSEGS